MSKIEKYVCKSSCKSRILALTVGETYDCEYNGAFWSVYIDGKPNVMLSKQEFKLQFRSLSSERKRKIWLLK